MEVTPEQLDELRALLMIGWFATCALLAIVNWLIISGRAAPKKPAAEHCKLHSRPLSECLDEVTASYEEGTHVVSSIRITYHRSWWRRLFGLSGRYQVEPK